MYEITPAVKHSFEKINATESISISLAAPNKIREWSHGEVKKPETINYRSYRAERDGLFCERIFGPERDWECSCGKYKGIKYKDIICDRCGVHVQHSRVRRQRFGHINLAAPVVHIWFFKSLPSKLGNLLGIKTTSLQQVVYFQRYVVTDPGTTPLKKMELLSDDDYHKAREKYGDTFQAGMGAEAVRKLILDLDLKKLSEELRIQLKDNCPKQKSEMLIKRLRIIEAFLAAPMENKPEWMVLDVIPVIPPDLRPLVPLESGNFATSDLNDLYRRVINRNNRLKKLQDLDAPGVIIRNEKRMLQQAVDALFDNSRCKRPVLGTGTRPLKSLTDMIKGKQGRFRENLLGKRVDYSARSVIVVGPDLKLNECGLPKKIALELYQPFIIHRLKQTHTDTIKSAKKMLEKRTDEVWDVLEEVIQGHAVLLNRAPTLHRMGIQAFFPKLVEGEAIMLHPLVCTGFNADFDGDQMAVHLPLSLEAQIEAKMLMASTNNIFSPANGAPIISADREIVLGNYWLTSEGHDEIGAGGLFGSKEEVFLAQGLGKVGRRAKIRFQLGAEWLNRGQDTILVKDMGGKERRLKAGSIIDTTVGRVIFNDVLKRGMAYYNHVMTKGAIKKVVADCFEVHDRPETISLLDRLKDLGFHSATVSGLSFAATDLKLPSQKKRLVEDAEKQVMRNHVAYERGIITDGERYRNVIDIWTNVRDQIWKQLMQELSNDHRPTEPHYANPIYMMTDAGARGSLAQVGQLAGMRGVIAKPSGELLETPIKANFREGLKTHEYFSSTHGARKGLADTALKTAHSGYLTRKLVEVAQDVTVSQPDCGTQQGITKGAVYRGEDVEVDLASAIRGRVARDNIVDLITGEVIVRENSIITTEVADKIVQFLGKNGKIRVRSALTCEAKHGVCAMCYGMDLSTGSLVELGNAVGIIAAQSVGEPGTQLTMRTFHIGGIGGAGKRDSEAIARAGGKITFQNLSSAVRKNEAGQDETVTLNRNAEIQVVDERDRVLDRHVLPVGSILLVKQGDTIQSRSQVAIWDPNTIPVLSEVSGRCRFEDIEKDVTMREELDKTTGKIRMVILEHRGDKHPQIWILDKKGERLGQYPIPEKAFLEVKDGQEIVAGTVLAKSPREMGRNLDITGGLPRVTELFEARKPKDPAIMADIDGVVKFGERRRGKRVIIVHNETTGMSTEYLVPHGKLILVRGGDPVREGDKLVDGPLVPHDILRISGEERLQQYILDEVQQVYRSQNVVIDDKHIEILIRQMMRRVVIEDPGDTDFLPSDTVPRWRFNEVNDQIKAGGKRPASGSPKLLGIAKASLQADSWISAASFQETTKVLTESAIAGRTDPLSGLKENVILGHKIPAGTGFRDYAIGVIHAEVPLQIQKVQEAQATPSPIPIATAVTAETPAAAETK
ncbi:MAG: DNA-directed RNA polymerase subunit beta' [Planctomycetota bacterium]